jgi:phospholipid/cholesterol/gamma-HCH transport system permease protein
MTAGRTASLTAHISDVMTSAAYAAWYTLEPEGDTMRLLVGGAWTRDQARRLDPQMRSLELEGGHRVEVDCRELSRLDIVGAWMLLRTAWTWRHQGVTVDLVNVAPEYEALVHTVNHACPAPLAQLPPHQPLTMLLERTGRGVWHVLDEAHRLLGFFGLVVVETLATVLRPRRLRVPAVVHQMEQVGLNSLPIVGLISLLIGVVVAYQGAAELHQFGADVFTVNLLSDGVLRELGGMMAAILVAGRSGSAFTAQIGTMKVTEELDAIQVGGFNPIQVLVLPRLLAIVITLPLLTFCSNIMGLIGGAIACHFYLVMPTSVFLHQLHSAIRGGTFWLGLIKAPVFACIIGLVGCHQGLQVERNAASIGEHTTHSVVEAIFLVIAANEIFSILFTAVGL